jgi:hypothetical protein
MLHPTWKIAIQSAEMAMGAQNDFLTGKTLLQPSSTVEGRQNAFMGVNMPPWMSTVISESIPMLKQLNAVNPGNMLGTSEKFDSQGNLQREATKAYGGLGAYRTDRDAKNATGRALAWMGQNYTELDKAMNAQKSMGDMYSMHSKVVSLIRKVKSDASLTNVPQPQKDRVIQELEGLDLAITDGYKRIMFWADQNKIPTKKAREMMIRNNILINDLPQAPDSYQPNQQL